MLIKLPRMGFPDVEFDGEKLVSCVSPIGRRHLDTPSTRAAHWFEVDVYSIAYKRDRYVHVKFRFSGKKLFRETEFDRTFPANDISVLRRQLDDFDATSCVVGFPPGDHFVGKQAALMELVAQDWATLAETVVTEVARLKPAEVLK